MAPESLHKIYVTLTKGILLRMALQMGVGLSEKMAIITPIYDSPLRNDPPVICVWAWASDMPSGRYILVPVYCSSLFNDKRALCKHNSHPYWHDQSRKLWSSMDADTIWMPCGMKTINYCCGTDIVLIASIGEFLINVPCSLTGNLLLLVHKTWLTILAGPSEITLLYQNFVISSLLKQ